MDCLRNIGLSFLLFAFGISSVRASVLENFSFSGANYTVVGQFTYDSSTGALQGITGNVTAIGPAAAGTGGAITSLVTSASPFAPSAFSTNTFFFDNTFDSTAGTFSFYGILFAFGAGNYGNLYYNSGAFLSTWLPDGPGAPSDCSSGALYCPGDPGTLSFTSVKAVPELSTWAMMLFGFLGLAILRRVFYRPLRTS